VANSKSAIKRIQINERNRMRNKTYKSAVRTLMKKYLQAVEVYSSNPSEDQKKAVDATMSAAIAKLTKLLKKVYSIKIMELEKKLD